MALSACGDCNSAAKNIKIIVEITNTIIIWHGIVIYTSLKTVKLTIAESFALFAVPERTEILKLLVVCKLGLA